LAGFEVTAYGRFWVTAEPKARGSEHTSEIGLAAKLSRGNVTATNLTTFSDYDAL